MITYLANFNADGISLSEHLTDTNKSRIYKYICGIAKASCKANSTATFYIADEWGKTILTGIVKSGVVKIKKNNH